MLFWVKSVHIPKKKVDILITTLSQKVFRISHARMHLAKGLACLSGAAIKLLSIFTRFFFSLNRYSLCSV